jgi:hypothetical protein
MATDNRTANRDYRLPNVANKMRSEEVPRLITTLEMIDADMAAVVADILGKADADHAHEMSEITGLVSALSGKAGSSHSHGIGTLTGVNLADAASGQLMGFNGTIWVPVTLTADHLANKIIANAKLRDSAAVSVMGRSANSSGTPGDIAAAANDRLFARVSDALSFVQLTIGMVPDSLLTFAKLASAALATAAEYRQLTVNKLISTDSVSDALAEAALTDASSISWNMASGINFSITLGGNRTLSNPSGTTNNKRGRIRVVQDGTGGRTLALGSNLKTAGGSGITLSTAAGAVDFLEYEVISSSFIRISPSKDWK